MAQPLNNSFENWDSPGTPGSSNGVCQNWTAAGVNGGTSTRQADAPTGGDSYSVNVRPSAAAPINSIGKIISDAFSLTNNYITFYARHPDASNVESIVRIFDSSDNLLAEGIIPYNSSWTQYYIDVTNYNGQSIKIQFQGGTTSAGAGYATYIDLVVCQDSTAGTLITLLATPNTALTGTASASSVSGTEVAANVNDDNAGSRWHQGTGVPKEEQWLKIDLGSSKYIHDIAITVEEIGATSIIYTIKGSNNDSDYDTLVSGYTQSAVKYAIHNFGTLQYYRYIKIDTFGGTITYAQLSEVRIYETESPTVQKTILSDAKIKVFSQQQTITSDALITGTVQQTITSDAKIKVFDQQQNILSDAKVVDVYQKTILSDAMIFADNVQKTILSDAKVAIQVLSDFNNRIRTVQQVLSDFNNKFTFVKRILSDTSNIITTIKALFYHVNQDFRMKRQELYTFSNDIRFIKSWQVPGVAGVQSLGKSYIRVYFDGVEQTDVDIDSINIDKSINTTHTASLDLGRAYDGSKPNVETLVLIKYNDWILYRGYIIAIVPNDNPESMTIQCNDEYWYQNRTNRYFLVGHAPENPREVYYPTIYGALNGLFSWNIDLGKFVPETINLFGVGISDCISTLLQESGNYGYYYDINGTKQLWAAGSGDIIELDRQTIGTNIRLYDVMNHQFKENVDNIINKYRVQMGDLVIKKYNPTQKSDTESSVQREMFDGYAIPAWDSSYEVIVTPENPGTGFGFNYPDPENSALYKEVFTKYNLPALNSDLESWSDEKEPIVELDMTNDLFFGWTVQNAPKNTGTELFPKYILTDGFTLDYKKRSLILNTQIYLYKTNENNEITEIKAPIIKLKLWKKIENPYTNDITDDPETTISNSLMFFTAKMGDYPTTILKNLQLSNLSIQIGGSYYDPDSESYIIYPTWNDSGYALDYANWQLSKTCDKRINGNIEITLDAACFYNIDLKKRIYINGITESAMNILSISYDISNFTVRLQLENSRAYKRTVSLPWRGE
jgi:hypothetical protein